jgi:hypothetical protein
MASDAPRTFNQGLDEVFADMRELMLRKQHDYGPTNIMETPIAHLAEAWGVPGIDPKVAGPQLGIYVRLNDKIARLYEGFKNGGETKVIGEALRDTWMDILGYALIALMVENGTFTDPLADEPGGDIRRPSPPRITREPT